jgi:hypothetical protein
VSPTANATSVAVTSAISATFNEPVQPSTITFVLKDASNNAVSTTMTYAASTNTATWQPSAALATSTTYTATISGVSDVNGNLMAAAYTWSFTTSASSASATSEPLLQASNLSYLGAFRVPEGVIGASQFDYGGSALAFNPAHNSLFAVGHPYDQAVAEVAIPSTIVNSSNVNNLAVAQVLQPFVSILPKIPNNPSSMSTGGYEAIGGLMVNNNQLIGTAFNTYDGSGVVQLSHFTLSSLTLASATASGLYQVGSLGGGFVGGYMTPVPAEWQSLLGAPDLTGQSALNIISRTSYGPDAFGFNPATLSAGVNPDIPYLYYDQNHTTLGGYGTNPPTLFNGTVGGENLTGLSAVFVPGTRSVLFFGAIGTGQFYYGEAAAANDPNRTFKGPHSVGGNYTFQVWAYDANDLLAVKNGQKNPWDITPYSTWNFSFPEPDGSKIVGGVAYDPTRGRIYLSEINADTSNQFSVAALIQVFQITLPPTRTLGSANVVGSSNSSAPAAQTATNSSSYPSPTSTNVAAEPGTFAAPSPVLIEPSASPSTVPQPVTGRDATAAVTASHRGKHGPRGPHRFATGRARPVLGTLAHRHRSGHSLSTEPAPDLFTKP